MRRLFVCPSDCLSVCQLLASECQIALTGEQAGDSSALKQIRQQVKKEYECEERRAKSEERKDVRWQRNAPELRGRVRLRRCGSASP